MKEQEERKKIIDYIFEIRDILDTANLFVKEGFYIPKGIVDDLLSIGNKIIQIRNFIVYNGDKELACFVNTINRDVLAQIQGWYNIPDGDGGRLAKVLAYSHKLLYETANSNFDSCVKPSEKEEVLQNDWLKNEKTEEISIATNAETAENEITLPSELDTEKARKCFAKAIKAGYMRKNDNGYKWLFGGNKGQARLGYFCNRVFVQPRPINKLESLFSVQKLSASITTAGYEATRADVKKWRDEMNNNIFND